MRKRLAILGCVAALGLGTASPAAPQGYDRVAQEETAEEDDKDWGWLGLIGLAGLGGLLGLRRRDDRRDVVRPDADVGARR